MKISVVIPCYRVRNHIMDVISEIGDEISKIYVVDDQCPEKSGEFVKQNTKDPRVIVLQNPINLGVGGAVITGYIRALADEMDVVVKIDGDGQMMPILIQKFIDPICSGIADYTKGNRFYRLDKIKSMPMLRIIGNVSLSFITKFSSGYWSVFDPTNGYTAISTEMLKRLPLDKISQRYFFESDMLFRLYIERAVVKDVPMDARYEEEVSGLKISKVIFEFTRKNVTNFLKRIFYTYFLRDLNIASIELVIGLLFIAVGLLSGSFFWSESILSGVPATAGTVMIPSILIILGVQLLLSFLNFDLTNVPIHVQGSTRIKKTKVNYE